MPNPPNPLTICLSDEELVDSREREIAKLRIQRGTELLKVALAETIRSCGDKVPTQYIAERAVGAAHLTLSIAEYSGELFEQSADSQEQAIQRGQINLATMKGG